MEDFFAVSLPADDIRAITDRYITDFSELLED